MAVVRTTNMTTPITISQEGLKGWDISRTGIEWCNITVSLSIKISTLFKSYITKSRALYKVTLWLIQDYYIYNDNIKTASSLSTEAFPRIEIPTIPLIKKEGEIQDKNITKLKLSCTSQVWVTSLSHALRTHIPNIIWGIYLIPTGRTLGHLSRSISQPATMALYASQCR